MIIPETTGHTNGHRSSDVLAILNAGLLAEQAASEDCRTIDEPRAGEPELTTAAAKIEAELRATADMVPWRKAAEADDPQTSGKPRPTASSDREPGDDYDALDQSRDPLHVPDWERKLIKAPAYQKPNGTNNGKGKIFHFERYTCRQFFNGKFDQPYLVDGVLAALEPFIIGGSKKTLKTTLMIDLAISLTAAMPFLGKFNVPKAIRVGIMSGESGKATLQETARRIALSKGWEPDDSDGLHWCFKVPRVGDRQHMQALEAFIVEDRLAVLFIDPTYLALPLGDNASNLFASGELLASLTEIGQRTRCAIGLLHHLRKTRPDAGQFVPPELDELAWSGFAEWARQWLLIGRREKYDPESDGEHNLWLNIGGSAGHCSLWAMDIKEGRKNDQGGRRWSVYVKPPSLAREEKQQQRDVGKELAKANTTKANMEKVLAVFKAFPNGDTKSALRDAAGMNGKVFGPILLGLLNDHTVIPCKVPKKNGSEYDGYKLRPTELYLSPGHPDQDPDGPSGSACPASHSDNPD